LAQWSANGGYRPMAKHRLDFNIPANAPRSPSDLRTIVIFEGSAPALFRVLAFLKQLSRHLIEALHFFDTLPQPTVLPFDLLELVVGIRGHENLACT
jgi:hypothetical protein